MTDPHVRFRALAAAYLAEVLPPHESMWMDTHLQECADCATLLERVRRRLPELAHDAGHLPVSVLERRVESPDEFTELERELVEHHLAGCERCRAEVEEMESLAGVEHAVTVPVHAHDMRPRALGWGLPVWVPVAAAAVLAAVFLSQLTMSRRANLRPATITPQVDSSGETVPGQPSSAAATELIVLPDRMRGAGADSAPHASVPAQGTALMLQLPPLFLGDVERVEARVVRYDGTIVWKQVIDARTTASPLAPSAPPGGWSPGRYRLEIVPGAGADTSATRTFDFRLVRQN